MKKTIVILTVILLSNVLGYAQNITVSKDKTIGGDQDENGGYLYFFDNNFYLNTNSGSSISGDRTVTKKGIYDQWLLRLDSNYTIEYQTSIGTNWLDFGNMYQDSNHFYLLITGDTVVSGDRTAPVKGNNGDIWLIKLDLNFNIIWQKAYGADSGAAPSTLHILPNHDILLLASSSSPASIDKTDSSRGLSDYWLLKLDSAGNKLWDKTFGGDSWDNPFAVTTDDNGNIYIAGESFSSQSGDKSANNFDPTNLTTDIWCLKLDPMGNKIWDITLGGNDRDYQPRLLLLNNALYMTCSSESPVSGNKTQPNFSSNYANIWLTKIEANTGAILWDKVYGGDVSENIWGLFNLNETLLIASTSSSNISGNKTENTKGGADYWIVNIDTSGNIIWQKDIGGNGNDIGAQILINNNFLKIVGISKSNISGDKTENSRGGNDIWIVDLNVVTGIQEFNKAHLFVYPNPAQSYLQVDFDTQLQVNAILYITDISGKVVYKQEHLQKYNCLNVNNLPSGNYIINVSNNDKLLFITKFVKM